MAGNCWKPWRCMERAPTMPSYFSDALEVRVETRSSCGLVWMWKVRQGDGSGWTSSLGRSYFVDTFFIDKEGARIHLHTRLRDLWRAGDRRYWQQGWVNLLVTRRKTPAQLIHADSDNSFQIPFLSFCEEKPKRTFLLSRLGTLI